MERMRVIVAPDSFKESLSAREVCAAITRGIRRVRPDAVIDEIPMADGGEGTVDALVSATGGELRRATVTGPLGEAVAATWGLLGLDGSATATASHEAHRGTGRRAEPVRESIPALGREFLVREALPELVQESLPELVQESLLASTTHAELVRESLLAPTQAGILSREAVAGPSATSKHQAPGRTAVIEMAAASGLAMVPVERRNPLLTTTYGTGELIRAARDAGATRLIVGIGGSATTDGGTGAAQALGYRFLDCDGRLIEEYMTGAHLERIARIERPAARDSLAGQPQPQRSAGPAAHAAADPTLSMAGVRMPIEAAITILVACDVDNPLHGPNGAACIYGPQKGATPEQVQQLDRNLAHLADVLERDLGSDVRDVPGAGAAGGLGAGLMAFFGARLDRGIHLVMEAVHFAERIRGADLIITGEGRLDAQSMMGKVIAGVGRAGREAGVPVIALAGCLGPGAEKSLELLTGFHVIHPEGLSREVAFAQTRQSLERTAAEVLKMWPSPSSGMQTR